MSDKTCKQDSPRARWALVIVLLTALAGLAVVALRIGRQITPPKVPYNPPQLETLTFTRLDGAAAPVRLSGFHFRVLGESMFPEFHQAAAALPAGEGGEATWEVTIGLTDGQRFAFTAQNRLDGDVWTAAGVQRPVRGDIELLLDAREGIAILELRTSHDFAGIEKAIEAVGDEEFDALILLAASPDRHQRAVALFALNYLISPRLRREQRMTAMNFHPADAADARMATDHPRATEVLAAALAAFDQWCQSRASTTDWSWLENALFEALGELADQTTADHLAAALSQRTQADYQAEDIMEALEQYYALPPLIQPLHFCATGESQASIARAAAQAQARRAERRELLLAWHQTYRGLPRGAQLAAAMTHWEAIAAKRDPYYLAAYPHNAVATFKPLLRKGPAIVPFIEGSKQKVNDAGRKAVFEMLIALATGTHDAALLDELARGEPQEREYARKIREVSTPR
jgi:hypothetical protein